MREFIDQMNRTVCLESVPRRIVSLVPSQTQLLHYLGLEDEVVGITKFCIHPNDWFRNKDRVGGTKNVDRAKVEALKPDLIIGNKEENDRDTIEEISKIAPVWMSDIVTLNDAFEMMEAVGEMTDKSAEVTLLVAEIKQRFLVLVKGANTSEKKGKSVLYFIWNDPNMIAGKNTFVDEMLSACGLVNLADEERYPETKGTEGPDYVFLSSEPFPFAEKHMADFQTIYPDSKIVLVDGEMFSWYGAKLIEAPLYFENLLTVL